MALQPIDITTPQPNGKLGDPARVMSEKINANDAYLEGLANEAKDAAASSVKKTGDTMTGLLRINNALAVQAGANHSLLRAISNGAGTTVFQSVTANEQAFAPLGLHGSSVELTGPTLVTNGRLTATQDIMITGTGAAYWFYDRTVGRDWAWYAADAVCRLASGARGGATADLMSINAAGAVSATSFNPTSSADVKDYLEGYDGDADDELDRLVVIRYKYRPEFVDSNKTFIGLLAENVHDVLPDATGGGEEYDVAVAGGSGTDGEDVEGDDPQPETRIVTARQPMNIDMMQILALSVRGHQQKNRRIRALEAAMETLTSRVQALESAQ